LKLSLTLSLMDAVHGRMESDVRLYNFFLIQQQHDSNDAQIDENADKCAYSYGTTQKDSKGSNFNVALDGKNYLVQRNWDPETQACSNGV
jgi:hypothetical protein